MAPNRPSALGDDVGDGVGLGEVEGQGEDLVGVGSARSATLLVSRAVATALSPAAMTVSASTRPRPVEHPVLSSGRARLRS
jgi:hypothetical protein